MAVRIRITDTGLDALKKFAGAFAGTMMGTMQTVMREIVWSRVKGNLMGRVLDRQSGALIQDVEDNIQVKQTFTGITGSIGTNLIYGVAWETGADFPAYTITPTKAKVLRFIGKDGDVVFTSMVKRTPRTEGARSYMEEAFVNRMGNIEKKFQADIDRFVAAVTR
jgi:hypothetical protein